MDYHCRVLSNLCRICGKRALKARDIKLKKKARRVGSYAGLIRLYFAIDTTNNEKNVHPEVCCNGCFTKFMDCKRTNYTISLEKMELDKKTVVTWKRQSGDNSDVCTRYSLQSLSGNYLKSQKTWKRPALAKMIPQHP